jgi:hypothetical protein
MMRTLPLVIGMLLAEGAAVWGLQLAGLAGERQHLVAALALLGATLVAGTALQGQRPRLVNAFADIASLAIVGGAAWHFFTEERSPWVLGWALVGLQSAMNLRLRTRRDTLFALFGALGVALVAGTDIWSAAGIYFVVPFAVGAALALAAKYYLDQSARSELPRAERSMPRLAAPGVLLYGIAPALLIALPLILFLPVLPIRPLPFQLPYGGIVFAKPPPAATGDKGLPAGGLFGGEKKEAASEPGKGRGGGPPGEEKLAGRANKGDERGRSREPGQQPPAMVPGGPFPPEELNAPRDPAELEKLAKREHPGGICVPRPKELEEEVPVVQPPRQDVCEFHVLNPYHHPALYADGGDAASSTVLRVRSSAPVYLRQQIYDRYDNGTWQCSTHGERTIEKSGTNRFFIDDQDSKQVWNLQISVEKPLTDMVPALLRPEFLRFGTPTLKVNSEHAITAPSPIEAGTRYLTESPTLIWQRDRPTTDGGAHKGNPNYLQVPPALIRHVAPLAARAVSGKRAALERGEALESYLRQNHRHALDKLGFTGDTGEPLADFLNGSKAGNAELFATAMVLMARSLGIPARLAVGHIAVRKELGGDGFIVHRLDAHAWAELYIDRYWTTFDPTPIRAVPSAAAHPSARLASILHYLESLDRLARAFDEVVPGSGRPETVWQLRSTAPERVLVQLWRLAHWIKANAFVLALPVALLALLAWLWRRHRERVRRVLLEVVQTDPRERVLAAFAGVERIAVERGHGRRESEHHRAFLGRLAAAHPPLAEPTNVVEMEFGRARYGIAPVDEAAASAAISACDAITASLPVKPPEAPPAEPPPPAESPPPELRAAPAAEAPRRRVHRSGMG